MAAKWFNSLDTNSTHNYCLGTYNLPYIIFSKKCKVGMVLCYQNCSDLLWEKIVLVIEKNFRSSRLKAKNLQKFWDHLNNLFILWVSWFKNKSFWQRFTCTQQRCLLVFKSEGAETRTPKKHACSLKFFAIFFLHSYGKRQTMHSILSVL